MTIRNFRILLIASLLIGVFGACLDLVFPALLSEAFHQAMAAEYSATSTPRLILFLVLGMAILAITCAAIYGLYKLRPWAPQWALWSTVLGLPLVILAGTTAVSGYAAATLYLASYCWGAVLLLAFLPPFSHQFQRRET